MVDDVRGMKIRYDLNVCSFAKFIIDLVIEIVETCEDFSSLSSDNIMASWILFILLFPKSTHRGNPFSKRFYNRPPTTYGFNRKARSSSTVITYCIFSCVAINEPIPR